MFKKKYLFSFIPLIFLNGASFPSDLKLNNQIIRETAPTSGWAGIEGGTTGGSNAVESSIFVVNNINELRDILEKLKNKPKIIQINSQIDISNGNTFRSFDDQKSRGQVYISSNTTLIGMNDSSGFINGTIVLKDIENVIIRKIKIVNPIDISPHYEKDDGWNAEWDGMNIINSKHIWLDHLVFSDGEFTDNLYRNVNGEKYVQHDGSLDIKKGSDLITISWSYFKNHDKNILIGNSDTYTNDRQKLRVTIHDSVFDNVSQRSPRVRFGKIHSYNNTFNGSVKGIVYNYKYSFGIGYEASLISESNSFNITDLVDECKILKVFNPHNTSFSDKNSYLNNKKINLVGNCNLSNISTPTWTPPYHYTLKNT